MVSPLSQNHPRAAQEDVELVRSRGRMADAPGAASNPARELVAWRV